MSENPSESPTSLAPEKAARPRPSNADRFGFIMFYGLVIIAAVITGLALRMEVVPTLP